jgi:membrane protein
MAKMTIVKNFARRLWLTYRGFQEHDGMLSAAGIAYYLALSFFPLLLVLLTGLSWVFEWTEIGQEAQRALLNAIAQQASPDLAHQVERSLDAVRAKAPSGGPIGFAVLIASAIAIFSQLDSAFDRIFHVPSDPHESWLHWVRSLVFQRLKALGMLLGVGGFIIMVMVTSMMWAGVRQALEPTLLRIGPWLEWASSFWINLVLNLAAFTILYRVIPKSSVRWRDALRGGLFAALLWEGGRQALAAYLLHLNYPSAYGIIGSFIAVMLWAYYASLVIILGAEYVRQMREEGQEQRELPLNPG